MTGDTYKEAGLMQRHELVMAAQAAVARYCDGMSIARRDVSPTEVIGITVDVVLAALAPRQQHVPSTSEETK